MVENITFASVIFTKEYMEEGKGKNYPIEKIDRYLGKNYRIIDRISSVDNIKFPTGGLVNRNHRTEKFGSKSGLLKIFRESCGLYAPNTKTLIDWDEYFILQGEGDLTDKEIDQLDKEIDKFHSDLEALF